MKMLLRQKLSEAGLRAARLRRPQVASSVGSRTPEVEPEVKPVAAKAPVRAPTYWGRYLAWEERLAQPILNPWERDLEDACREAAVRA